MTRRSLDLQEKFEKIVALLRSNFILVATSTVANMLVRAGIFIAIAPIIGPAKQGTFVVVSSWSAMFCILVGFGMNVRALKVIPENAQNAYAFIKGDLISMIPLALAAAIMAQIFVFFFLPQEDWTVFWIVFVATVFSRYIDYCSCALRGLNNYPKETLLAVISATSQFGLMVGVGLIYRDLLPVAIALLVSRLLAAAASIFVTFNIDSVKDSISKKANSVIYTIKSSYKFAIDSSLFVVLQQIDILLLNMFASREAIGIYSAAYRLLQLIMAFPWVVNSISTPAIVRTKDLALKQKHVLNFKIFMLGGVLAGAFALLVLGPLFVEYFLSKDYAAVNDLWPIVSVLLVAKFLESYLGTFMLIDDKIGHRAISQILAIITILICGVLIIPVYGSFGLLGVMGLASLISAFYYQNVLSAFYKMPKLLLPLLAIVIMAGFVMLILWRYENF